MNFSEALNQTCLQSSERIKLQTEHWMNLHAVSGPFIQCSAIEAHSFSALFD